MSVSETRPTMLKCEFDVLENIGFMLLWFLLIIITLGLASLFFIYSFNKTIVNKTYVLSVSGGKIGKMQCDFSVFSAAGNILLWCLLILVTLGLAAPFYVFRVKRTIFNNTRIVYY